MIGGHQGNGIVVQEPSPQLSDSLTGTQQVLYGNASHRQNHGRFQDGDLGLQIGAAGIAFLRLRIPVFGRAAFDDVGDVAVGAASAPSNSIAAFATSFKVPSPPQEINLAAPLFSQYSLTNLFASPTDFVI